MTKIGGAVWIAVTGSNVKTKVTDSQGIEGTKTEMAEAGADIHHSETRCAVVGMLTIGLGDTTHLNNLLTGVLTISLLATAAHNLIN